jgi:hypothetical protein
MPRSPAPEAFGSESKSGESRRDTIVRFDPLVRKRQCRRWIIRIDIPNLDFTARVIGHRQPHQCVALLFQVNGVL